MQFRSFLDEPDEEREEGGREERMRRRYK